MLKLKIYKSKRNKKQHSNICIICSSTKGSVLYGKESVCSKCYKKTNKYKTYKFTGYILSGCKGIKLIPNPIQNKNLKIYNSKGGKRCICCDFNIEPSWFFRIISNVTACIRCDRKILDIKMKINLIDIFTKPYTRILK